MKSISGYGHTLLLAGLAALPLACFADSEDAFCEVREHGEAAKDATGYCTISELEGRVVIELANGRSVELQPGEREGRFQDREGRGVDREIKPDGSHTYRWAHRHITVYFDRAEGQFF